MLSTKGDDELRHNVSVKSGNKLVSFMKNEMQRLEYYSYNPRMIPDEHTELHLVQGINIEQDEK